MFGKITLKELTQLVNYSSFYDSYYHHQTNHLNIRACICFHGEAKQIDDAKNCQKKEAFMFITDKDDLRIGFTDLISKVQLKIGDNPVQLFQNFVQKKLIQQSRFIRTEDITKIQLKQDKSSLHINYKYFENIKKIHVKLKQEQAEIWKDMLYGILNHMNHKKSINFKKNNHEVYTHQSNQQTSLKWGIFSLNYYFGNNKYDLLKQQFLEKNDKYFQFKKKLIETIQNKKENYISLAQDFMGMVEPYMLKASQLQQEFEKKSQEIQTIRKQLDSKKKQLILSEQKIQSTKLQVVENQSKLQQSKLQFQKETYALKDQKNLIQNQKEELLKQNQKLINKIEQIRLQKVDIQIQKNIFKNTAKQNEKQYNQRVAKLQLELQESYKNIDFLNNIIKNKQADYNSVITKLQLDLQKKKDDISLLNNTIQNKKLEYKQVVAKIQEDLDRKKYDIGLLNTKIKDLKAGYKQLENLNTLLSENKEYIQNQLAQQKVNRNTLQAQKAQITKQNMQLHEQNSELKQKIVTANRQNQNLLYQIQENRKENLNLKQIISTCKHDLDQTISELQRQRNNCEEIKKQASKEMLLNLFGGNVLENTQSQKSFLKTEIEKCTGKVLSFTRLIFKHDPFNPTSFHHYIDEHPNICVVVKLKNGRFVAGFSISPLSDKTVANQSGIICSLTEKKTYKLCEGKRSVTYDKFFLIFGNSELRLKQGEVKFFTNFGIATSYFDSNGDKYTVLNGVGTEREVIYENFEIFEVFFK